MGKLTNRQDGALTQLEGVKHTDLRSYWRPRTYNPIRKIHTALLTHQTQLGSKI